MQLEIENSAELLAAIKAVQEFRKTQVRHVGRFAQRLEFPCEQTTREMAFAARWEWENSPERSFGTPLETLLTTDPHEHSRVMRRMTPEEVTAVATVVQWLGSNVGWCFLCGCIKAAGYSEPRKLP